MHLSTWIQRSSLFFYYSFVYSSTMSLLFRFRLVTRVLAFIDGDVKWRKRIRFSLLDFYQIERELVKKWKSSHSMPPEKGGGRGRGFYYCGARREDRMVISNYWFGKHNDVREFIWEVQACHRRLLAHQNISESTDHWFPGRAQEGNHLFSLVLSVCMYVCPFVWFQIPVKHFFSPFFFFFSLCDQ